MDTAKLDAIERLHGWRWFWERTLWEIENQPIVWGCFVLVVLAIVAGLAVLIVAVTMRRRARAISMD